MATPKKRKPKTAGRKTRYRPENATIARALIAGGMTQEQAMVAMDISKRSWYNWKERYPEFMHAITNTNEENIRLVEKSLLKRALGYEYKETQTTYEEDGSRVKKSKKVLNKTQAPSDVAIQFFLTNKKPKDWKRIPDENQEQQPAVPIPVTFNVDRKSVV